MNKPENIAMYFDGNGGYEKSIKAYTNALKVIADIALKIRASDEAVTMMIAEIPVMPHTEISGANIHMPVHHHHYPSEDSTKADEGATKIKPEDFGAIPDEELENE